MNSSEIRGQPFRTYATASAIDPLQEAAQARRAALQLVLALDMRAGLAAEALAHLRTLEHQVELPCERRRIARRDEDSGAPADHRAAHRADVACHHRSPGRH